MKIATITAGHSNIDSGAVNGKTKESDLVVLFRNAVAHYLRQSGIQVVVDGVGLDNKPLKEAISLISGSDVAIEFHMNASSNSSANGVETIALPKDKALAQKLSKSIADVFNSKLRGDNGWIDQSQSARGKLGYINAGGLIVEIEFISNPEKLKAFNEKYWQAAKAVSQGEMVIPRAEAIHKLAKKITESLYSETKIQMFRHEVDHAGEEFGQLLLGDPSDDEN